MGRKTIYIYIYNFARKWTSTFFAFGGIIALFVSFDDIFCAEWYHKLLFALFLLFAVFAICCFIGAVVVINTKEVKLFDVGNNHAVYVKYGDVFSEELISNNLILSISLDTFSTQNSKQVRKQLSEMEQISTECSRMDICSI